MKTKSVYFPAVLSCCYAAIIICSTFCNINTLKAQPQIRFKTLMQNLDRPLEIKNAGDGSNRIFIAEQGGLIKIYKNGSLLVKPFLDLRAVVGVGNFFGIWSIAFSPNYKNNRFFFVFYTTRQGVTILARFKTSKTNPDSAMANSVVTLLSFPKSDGIAPYGDLHFGNDNYLYISVSGTNNINSAQNGKVLYGKMLRLNVNVLNFPYYTIPADNPFVNDPAVKDEIWAMGLRNAWRWSFDRPSGDIWIADEGETSVDEVNYRTPAQSPGSNYGWRCYEGTKIYNQASCGNQSKYVFPIFESYHGGGDRAVIGGYVYRGSAYPSLQGYYICADLASKNVWKIKPDGMGGWNVSRQTGGPFYIASFGESENKELYAVSWQLGNFYRVKTIASTTSTVIAAAGETKIFKSHIYPNLVNNSTLVLELKEQYQSVRITDILGHVVLNMSLDNRTGSVMLNLPQLNAGIYIVNLTGHNPLQQKIYVTN